MAVAPDPALRDTKAQAPQQILRRKAKLYRASAGPKLLRGLLFFVPTLQLSVALAQGAAVPAAAPSGGTTSIAASVYAPASSGGGMVWLSFITLVLLAGVVLLVAWLVHKNMSATVPNSSIRILSVQTLGPRERIVIASVVGRVFVLGHTASQISLIAELEPQEVAGMSSSPAPVDFAARLSEILRRSKK